MSLRSLLIGFAALILLLAFSVAAMLFNRGLSDYSRSMSELAVQVRGTALADSMERALATEWAHFSEFASSVDHAMTVEGLQEAVDGFQYAGTSILWAGLARADGTVVAASKGMLVGESVAQRPWFQLGLESTFAGDVQEAQLLHEPIAPGGATPSSLVAFSLPLTNAQGQVWGVLGAHISSEWVRGLVGETADSLDIDAFLADRSGDILVSTAPEFDRESLRSLTRAASVVSSGSSLRDGANYYSFIVPDVGLAQVSSLGWSLVVLLDPSPIRAAQSQFARFMLIGAALIALAGILVATVAFTIFLRPLIEVTDAMSRLSKGEDIGFLPGSMLYREVVRLTNSLARFQTKDADRRKAKRTHSGPPQ